MRRISLLTLTTIAVIASALFTWATYSGLLRDVDASVAEWAMSLGWLSPLMVFISASASIQAIAVYYLVILVLDIYLDRGVEGKTILLGAGLVLVSILVLAIKAALQIPRPRLPGTIPDAIGLGVVNPDFFAYPSGHVSRATVLASLLPLFFRERLRKGSSAALWIWVFLTSLSRIILGCHWFSDVIGGFLFGITTSLIIFAYKEDLLKVYRKVLERFRHFRLKEENVELN